MNRQETVPKSRVGGRSLRSPLLALLLAAACAQTAFAAEVTLAPVMTQTVSEDEIALPRYDDSLAPVVSLPRISQAELDAFAAEAAGARTAGGREMVGKLRRFDTGVAFDSSVFPAASRVDGFSVADTGEEVVVSFMVEIQDDAETRLLIEDIQFAGNAVFAVVVADGSGRRMDYFPEQTRSALLPAVRNQRFMVAVSVASSAFRAGGLRFTLAGVSQVLVDETEPMCEGEDGRWTACAVSAACVEAEQGATMGVARLSWLSGGSSWLCTGTLLNSRNAMLPYVLTANHCLSTQAEASTLQARFDYRPAICGGTPPSTFEVPSVYGAELVRTNTSNDMTFLRLHDYPPGGRWFFGWTTANMQAGTTYKRLSHPAGSYMRYSQGVQSGGFNCSSRPGSHYWYTQNNYGSTSGGSSGSAIYRDDGVVLGQLYGVCYSGTLDYCNYAGYRELDGRFSVTYPLLEPWLEQAITELQVDTPLAGQASAVSPLTMRYYRFDSWSAGPWDSYVVRLSGNAANADLYVKVNDWYWPMTTSWDCRATGTDNEKTCLIRDPWGQAITIGVHARAAYSGLVVEVSRLPESIFDNDFDFDGPVHVFALEDFQVLPAQQGGEPIVRFGPVFVTGPVAGVQFNGTITGINESPNWASDLRMEVISPSGAIFDVGGYQNLTNPWFFQGAPIDGTYTSTHFETATGAPIFGADGTPGFGIWTFRFSHDFPSETSTPMHWSDVSVVLIGR